jgi:branched-subunit amino acid aminotransferase/4-amino-4-deoxychorismate lyase
LTLCLDSSSNIADVDLSRDRGFLLGDGVFETLRVQEGAILWLEAHLRRLKENAGCYFLPFPWETDAVRSFLSQNLPKDKTLFRLRLTLTAGEGGRGYQRPEVLNPRLFAFFSPAQPSSDLTALELCPERVPEDFPAKTLSGLSRILKAPPAGREWVMLSERGFLTECCMANIFWFQGDILKTPRLNGSFLAGLTRQRVVSLASLLDISLEQDDYKPEVLQESAEIFLTGSVAGLVSVRSFLGKTLQMKKTQILKDAYEKLIQKAIALWFS